MSFYENHNLEDKELPFIYKEQKAQPIRQMLELTNWHENIEIIYIAEGKGTVSNNGQLCVVSKGDIVFINANHLHSLAAEGQTMTYHYLIADRSFCLVNGFDTNAISFSARIDDGRARALMEDVHGLYSQPTETPFRTPAIRSAVLRLLVLLCREHSIGEKLAEQPERSIAYIKQAIAFIRASYDRNFSLEEAAEYVGVNKCYLSREFHRYTGYSFVEYVNRTRCRMAQQLLREERLSIGEVGKRCGFDNRSYFARTFQRYVGMLPGEYRAGTGRGSLAE